MHVLMSILEQGHLLSRRCKNLKRQSFLYLHKALYYHYRRGLLVEIRSASSSVARVFPEPCVDFPRIDLRLTRQNNWFLFP